MNAYFEEAWNIISQMAHRMMVHEDLSLHFWYEAHHYEVEILQVLPEKGIHDDNDNHTTPYFLVHNRKPHIGKFYIVGCTWTFKSFHTSYHTCTVTNKLLLQCGYRGTFVGYAPHQDGYLIDIQEPIKNSHLITLQDVTSDDDFLTSTSHNEEAFHRVHKICPIGQDLSPNIMPKEHEQIGDAISTF